MTNTLLSHLAIGLAVSFAGSIPPGAINLTAVKISLEKGYRSVVTFALAVALVEFFYGMIAVYGAAFLASYPSLAKAMEYTTILFFIGLGSYYIWDSRGNAKPKPPKTSAGRMTATPFFNGLLLAIFNPMCIPFWIAYTSYLQMRHWIHPGHTNTLFYMTGIAAGAFAALVLFGLLGKQISANLSANTRLLNRTVGATLLLLGIYKWIVCWL